MKGDKQQDGEKPPTFPRSPFLALQYRKDIEAWRSAKDYAFRIKFKNPTLCRDLCNDLAECGSSVGVNDDEIDECITMANQICMYLDDELRKIQKVREKFGLI